MEVAFGDDFWIAEGMLEGKSINELGRQAGNVTKTGICRRNNRAKARAAELAAAE